MRQYVIRFGLAGLAVGSVATPAHAFYWVGWPGANPVTPPAVLSTTERVPERPPSVVEPTTPPTGDPGDPADPTNPKGVPEPATVGLAAIGLGALAVRWCKKRKK